MADEAAVVAGERLARWLRGAVRRRGSASLALSGGSTAPPMIEALVAHDVPWEQITVWQVDERIRPDGHPARNANQLDALPCRVRPMPVTATDLRAAARRYGSSLPERFDAVHLGVGDDGHTASRPPARMDVITSRRPVELVADFHGHDRMTLTGRVVNGARARLVLAVGAGKQGVVERWLLDDHSLPITAVRRASTVAVIDPAAAPRAPRSSVGEPV